MKFDSMEWNEIQTTVQERLRDLDIANRNPNLTHDQTSTLRGQIGELLWLLDWPKRAQASVTEQGIDFGI